MKEMFSQPIKAIFSAARLLFQRPRALFVMLAAYAGLLGAIYLFVSTREATIAQLILTLAVALVAPALFFVLQAASVSYTTGPLSRSLIRNCLRLVVVSVPVIGITLLGVYGLGKIDSYVTITTALRYLLIGVVAPLLAIRLWIVASGSGLRGNLKKVVANAFAPQPLFVYCCGFVIFAVVPYLLLTQMIRTETMWLEFSFLMLKLVVSGLLILLGWVMTVGAISILNHGSNATGNEK